MSCVWAAGSRFLFDDGGGGTDGQLGELAPQVGGGLGLGGLDVGGGAGPGLGQLRLEPGLLVRFSASADWRASSMIRAASPLASASCAL